MRDNTGLVAFIGGTIFCVAILGLLVLLGPGVIPSQLDRCWQELRKNQPNCSVTTNKEGAQFIRDSRCISGKQTGMVLVWQDVGWWRISRVTPPKTEGTE